MFLSHLWRFSTNMMLPSSQSSYSRSPEGNLQKVKFNILKIKISHSPLWFYQDIFQYIYELLTRKNRRLEEKVLIKLKKERILIIEGV